MKEGLGLLGKHCKQAVLDPPMGESSQYALLRGARECCFPVMYEPEAKPRPLRGSFSEHAARSRVRISAGRGGSYLQEP
jgi:hypothetical protein